VPSKIVCQLEHFPPQIVAGHGQYRFVFEQPVLLFEPRLGQKNSLTKPAEKLHEVVFSAEYFSLRKRKYSLLRGLFQHKDFRLIPMFISHETKAHGMVRIQDHKVSQWELAVNAEDRAKIFAASLALAHETKLGKSYHAIMQNCTTEFFDVLDLALGIVRFAPLLAERIPALFSFAIFWRSLKQKFLGKKLVFIAMPSLNQELSKTIKV
jgi:hypothetical protein